MFNEYPKQPEQRERGTNCELKITFRRHAHKEIFDPHQEGAISDSGLSDRGREAAFGEGYAHRPLGNRVKTYASPFKRTEDTGEELVVGMEQAAEEHGDTLTVYETRHASALTAPHFSKEKVEEYRSQFTPLPENVEELEPIEQERLIEDMEIPAANQWVKDWEKKPDAESESAAEIARRLAEWLAKKDRAIERYDAGSEVELLAVTHRTATEPFLCLCTGKSLEELGGPLDLLEGWEFTIKTDEKGEKSYRIQFRGQEYRVSWQEIREKVGL